MKGRWRLASKNDTKKKKKTEDPGTKQNGNYWMMQWVGTRAHARGCMDVRSLKKKILCEGLLCLDFFFF